MEEKKDEKTEEEKKNESEMKIPLEIIDKCINQNVFILMKDSKEISGKLLSFDDCVNMILEDVSVFEYDKKGNSKKTDLKKILLNGNRVCMIIPGSKGPDDPLHKNYNYKAE